MKSESCAHCGEREELTVIDVPTHGAPDKPQTLKAVVCVRCGAQGPKHETAEGAMREWKHRFVNFEVDDNTFVVGYGYEKFILTLEQVLRWREVSSLDTHARLQEQRYLLQQWQLLPPSKYVETQRTF